MNYCNEYKLILILQMEDDCNKWQSLKKHIFYSPQFKSSNHFKGIHSQYIRWCKKKYLKKHLKVLYLIKIILKMIMLMIIYLNMKIIIML